MAKRLILLRGFVDGEIIQIKQSILVNYNIYSLFCL